VDPKARVRGYFDGDVDPSSELSAAIKRL
jgi:hypothetical protein